MKLQSQATMRFDAKALRDLAKHSRPGAARRRRRNEAFACALAGFATGLLLVRLLLMVLQ